MELSSSKRQGALIIIKEPAARVNSDHCDALGEKLKQNHTNWFQFVRTVSPNLDLREMVFVTGYDLASDWATASVTRRNENVRLRFKVGDPQTLSAGTSLWGSWQCFANVPVRSGPSALQRSEHMEVGREKNQCIFFRGFRIDAKFMIPRLRAAAGPHNPGAGDNEPEDPVLPMKRNEDDAGEELDKGVTRDDKASTLRQILKSRCILR